MEVFIRVAYNVEVCSVEATVNKEETVRVEAYKVLVVTVEPTRVEKLHAVTKRVEAAKVLVVTVDPNSVE